MRHQRELGFSVKGDCPLSTIYVHDFFLHSEKNNSPLRKRKDQETENETMQAFGHRFQIYICFFCLCFCKVEMTQQGRPGKASICKSVYLQPWQCRFLFACSYTAKSEPFSLWQACDYLKWMVVSGTEIRSWIFQLLLNPIFQMQFSIKILSQK